MKNLSRQHAYLKVECPKCNAEVGHQCWMPNLKYFSSVFHTERKALAISQGFRAHVYLGGTTTPKGPKPKNTIPQSRAKTFKDGISGNCKVGRHRDCYSAKCVCACHNPSTNHERGEP